MSAFAKGKFVLGAACATALVVTLAGCGSSSAAANPAAGSGPATTLKTMSTSIGTVLVSASGLTVYELVGDTAAAQTCTGDCLAAWPLVLANGSQMIVNGHPAFTFTGDRSAGETNGQNVTDQWGRWLALDANGNPISASAATSPPAATTTAPAAGGAAF